MAFDKLATLGLPSKPGSPNFDSLATFGVPTPAGSAVRPPNTLERTGNDVGATPSRNADQLSQAARQADAAAGASKRQTTSGQDGTQPASLTPAPVVLDQFGRQILDVPEGFDPADVIASGWALDPRRGGFAAIEWLRNQRPDALRRQSIFGTSDSKLGYLIDEETASYTGSDIRAMIEIADPSGEGAGVRRQLTELTTLSISVHRVKSPVRACGYINPKGFARGSRTIAGTMVLTQFTADVLYRFLFNGFKDDLSKDSLYVKPDQLPPFNLTLVFADEFGHASYQRILGVDVATDGVVRSVQDSMTEQTWTFLATDFTPLLPADVSSIFADFFNEQSNRAKAQRTPRDIGVVDPVIQRIVQRGELVA